MRGGCAAASGMISRKAAKPASRMSAPYRNESDGLEYAVLRMPAMTSVHRIAAE